jgi:hypothetical protein
LGSFGAIRRLGVPARHLPGADWLCLYNWPRAHFRTRGADWLCFALHTSHLKLQTSPNWVCLAQSAAAWAGARDWVCLYERPPVARRPRLGLFVHNGIPHRGGALPIGFVCTTSQRGELALFRRFSRKKRKNAKETCSPATLGWGQRITPGGGGATCLPLSCLPNHQS